MTYPGSVTMRPVWSFPDIDEAARAAARARQDTLTKPPGSLGELEAVAVELAGIQGAERPSSRPAAALLFAADHPVVAHGVSAFPQAVTAAMVQNFVAGGAAASVLARAHGVPLTVIDVGVVHPYDAPGVVRAAAAADATVGDLRTEDAMSPDAYGAALAAGAAAVDALADDVRVVVLGEMGIGNTTPAAAVGAALLGVPAEDMVGAGTGVAGDALAHKIAVVRDGVARIAGETDAHRIVQAVGGRDIAALMGAAARAIERRIAVLVDGFIVTAAMAALVHADERARRGMLFAHRSQERGHNRLLHALDARPLLDLSMRLGEGSGALAALSLVDHACVLHAEMATFADAAVPEREGE